MINLVLFVSYFENLNSRQQIPELVGKFWSAMLVQETLKLTSDVLCMLNDRSLCVSVKIASSCQQMRRTATLMMVSTMSTMITRRRHHCCRMTVPGNHHPAGSRTASVQKIPGQLKAWLMTTGDHVFGKNFPYVKVNVCLAESLAIWTYVLELIHTDENT